MEEHTFTYISKKLNLTQSQVSKAYKTGMEKLLVECERRGYSIEELLSE